MINRLILALAASLCAGPVWAQAQIPEGCEPLATVHKNGCAVSTLFQCADGFTVHGYHEGRLDQVHYYDSGWGLRGFLYQGNNETRFDTVPGGETMKLSDLVADGEDVELGTMLFSTRVVKGREFTLEGTYTLTDEVVTLDGVDFKSGSFLRMFERPGVEGSRGEFEFDILVSEERNLFIEGSSTRFSEQGEPVHFDNTPRAIRFQGQEGFLASQSQFGCE